MSLEDYDDGWNPKPSIQQRFEAFDAEHPDIFLLFERFALELLNAGHKRYGAKSIFERIRWHYATSGYDVNNPSNIDGVTKTFKINDHYTSRYVRRLIDKRPEFEDFFELRVLRTK